MLGLRGGIPKPRKKKEEGQKTRVEVVADLRASQSRRQYNGISGQFRNAGPNIGSIDNGEAKKTGAVNPLIEHIQKNGVPLTPDDVKFIEQFPSVSIMTDVDVIAPHFKEPIRDVLAHMAKRLEQYGYRLVVKGKSVAIMEK